ncbi:hypothetical protein [Streptomyces zhihengii]
MPTSTEQPALHGAHMAEKSDWGDERANGPMYRLRPTGPILQYQKYTFSFFVNALCAADHLSYGDAAREDHSKEVIMIDIEEIEVVAEALTCGDYIR